MSESVVRRAPTVGEIARRLGEPVHRVEYVIRARGLKPVAWAGHARVFAEADVDRIAAELRDEEPARSEETGHG